MTDTATPTIDEILQSPRQFCDLETFISLAETALEQAAEIVTLRAQVARVTTWANYPEEIADNDWGIGYKSARHWVREVGLAPCHADVLGNLANK